LQQSCSDYPDRTGRRLNSACQLRWANKKPTVENDDGILQKNNREFRSPTGLFLTGIADLDDYVVQLIQAA
jgi:hypothetical protein